MMYSDKVVDEEVLKGEEIVRVSECDEAQIWRIGYTY